MSSNKKKSPKRAKQIGLIEVKNREPMIFHFSEQTYAKWNLKEKTAGFLRPNIEGLVVNGKNAEEDLLERPFGAIIAQDVLVVFEIAGEGMVLHQLVLHLLPQPPARPLLPGPDRGWLEALRQRHSGSPGTKGESRRPSLLKPRHRDEGGDAPKAEPWGPWSI